MRIMFDTNVFDKMLSSADDVEIIVACTSNDYFITSVQKEELANIRDENKKYALLEMCTIVAKATPTPAVVGYSKVGDCVLVDLEDIYSDLLTETHSNVKDAMIGSAAKRELCTVVTNDIRFSKRLINCHIPTMTYEDF